MMGRTDNGKELELFDYTEQTGEPTRNGTAGHPQEPNEQDGKFIGNFSTWEGLKEAAERADGFGMYIPLCPETLYKRGKSYVERTEGAILAALKEAGLSDGTTYRVLCDFTRAAFGLYNFSASPRQILETLKKMTPHRAFLVDRDVFFTVLQRYSIYLKSFLSYKNNFAKNPNTEQKKRIMEMEMGHNRQYLGMGWLIDNDFVKVEHFSGIDASYIGEFINYERRFASIYDFCQYYHAAKFTYFATPEELGQISTPRGFSAGTDFRKIGEDLSKKISDERAFFANMYAKVTDARTEDERKEAEEVATDWTDKTTDNRCINLNEDIESIGTRPLNVSPHGKVVTNTVAIGKVIDEFVNMNKEFKDPNFCITITPYIVAKVIDAVGVFVATLPQQKKNEVCTIETNISRFSELCGYKDANQQEKNAIIGALRILNGLYITVYRPKGIYGVNVANLREIALTGEEIGKLTIDVPADVVKRCRNHPINAIGYDDLRREAKGEAKTRFRHQITSKTHKTEEELLSEVFGYGDLIKEAEESGIADDLRDVTEYVRKNKPNWRKKIEHWFAEYEKDGYIKDHERKQGKKGEIVHSWELGPNLNKSVKQKKTSEDNKESSQKKKRGRPRK